MRVGSREEVRLRPSMVTDQHERQRENEEPIVTVPVAPGETEDEVTDEGRLQSDRQITTEVGATTRSMIGVLDSNQLREGDAEQRQVNAERRKSRPRGDR